MSREITWVRKPIEPTKTYRCPCCHFKTLFGRGQDEICEVCFWQDDGQDEQNADAVVGGPNKELSLTEARSNFRQLGAINERWTGNVRPPSPDEI
ncbi:MAG: hypothetical protein KGK01_12500 [Bradyrhizobium sp.]|uniref:CPCC family cysteine-rich protein n=1 Tax=Bradyrhizobium sp. TaxID=376 RepID=UPI001C29C5DE|nr:hypothetical protein [Pseudomonadota bacterium]MDE2066408.1 hypothetical protein [Bradyrhizobium sp.]MDE2243221.1 hypothetical protein [Bradyrhizobium sp.]